MRQESIVAFTLVLCLCGCSELDSVPELVETQHALKTCTIVLGGGGKSQTISPSFNGSSGNYTVNTSKAWDFVRSTSGDCTFTIYNDANQRGRYVTLGTNLDKRIRAGEDGIRYKDDGGGATWRVRSVKIEPVANKNCFVSIGGGGVRMHYYPGSYAQVPAMDRISYFWGGNCDAKAWNGFSYGANDSDNRYVGLRTNALNSTQASSRAVFDPGFRVRSLTVRDWGTSNCTSATNLNRDYGRCLPSIMLNSSIYSTTSATDRDRDGLNDELENVLADAFTAIAMNHSTEDATRPYAQSDITNNTDNSYPYYDHKGNPVIEPVVVFQTRKAASDLNNRIEVAYMQIWKRDKYGATLCPGHWGDTQSDVFTLETPPVGNALHGKFWWFKSTRAMSSATRVAPASFAGSMLDGDDYGVDEDPTGYAVDSASFHTVYDPELIATQESLELESLDDVESESIDDRLMGLDLELVDPSIKDADKSIAVESMIHSGSNVVPTSMDSDDVSNKNTSEFDWVQGDTHMRGPIFENMPGDPANTNRHMIYHYSKGKHHAYIDGMFSGQQMDKSCGSINVYTNGRGSSHSPSYPRRLWNLRAPTGDGDSYKYNNVGSRNAFSGFVNRLDNYGFPWMKVWRDACFYSEETSSANKSFYCSNSTNKQCCLETNPGCSIPSNDKSWCCASKYNTSDCSHYSDVSNPSSYNTTNVPHT